MQHSDKMASLATFRKFLLFIFVRFPFVNALTFLMLLAERSSRESYPFLHPKLIYGQVIMFIIVGVALSANLRRKDATLVYCGQLLYMAYAIYTSDRIKYGEWQKFRMIVRICGTVGIYCIFAYLTDLQTKSVQLRRIGETMIGIFLVCLNYMLVNFKEDNDAFLHHVIGGSYVVYIVAAILLGCGIAFFMGQYIRDISAVCAITLFFLTIFTDLNIGYWQLKGVDFWNQFRMITDDMCIICGLLIIATSRKSSPQKID